MTGNLITRPSEYWICRSDQEPVKLLLLPHLIGNRRTEYSHEEMEMDEVFDELAQEALIHYQISVEYELFVE